MYSITFYAAISYSDTNVLFISSTILFNCCSTKPSVISLPLMKLRTDFFRFYFK
nr:MAG TPA: hypothetical protein [Caudoviricetes sp.]